MHVHLRIHLSFDPTALTRGRARIEDDLGVLAGEENDTDDPASITQDRTPEKDHVRIHRVLRAVRRDHSGIHLVQIRVGTVAIDVEGVALTRALPRRI